MKRYFIEPGDWEAATGECLPRDRHGIVVVPLEDVDEMLAVIRRLAIFAWMSQSELTALVKKCKEIVQGANDVSKN
jgi:hypothetical protein